MKQEKNVNIAETLVDFAQLKPVFKLLGCCQSLSHVQLFATPYTVAHQAPFFMEFSRQEYGSGQPFPSPGHLLNPGIKPGSHALQILYCLSHQNKNFLCWDFFFPKSHISIQISAVAHNFQQHDVIEETVKGLFCQLYFNILSTKYPQT